jgi:hypothetical protein
LEAVLEENSLYFPPSDASRHIPIGLPIIPCFARFSSLFAELNFLFARRGTWFGTGASEAEACVRAGAISLVAFALDLGCVKGEQRNRISASLGQRLCNEGAGGWTSEPVANIGLYMSR